MNVKNGLWAVVARTASVAVLTPLILVAGLIALVAVPALILSRHIGAVLTGRDRPPLAPVVHLDASHAESATAMAGHRAA